MMTKADISVFDFVLNISFPKGNYIARAYEYTEYRAIGKSFQWYDQN